MRTTSPTRLHTIVIREDAVTETPACKAALLELARHLGRQAARRLALQDATGAGDESVLTPVG